MTDQEVRPDLAAGAAGEVVEPKSAAHPFGGRVVRVGPQVRFQKVELNCRSSAEWGLGTCWCVNHPTFVEHEIGFSDVIEALKEKEYEYITASADENGVTIKIVLSTIRNQYNDRIEDELIYIDIYPPKVEVQRT